MSSDYRLLLDSRQMRCQCSKPVSTARSAGLAQVRHCLNTHATLCAILVVKKKNRHAFLHNIPYKEIKALSQLLHTRNFAACISAGTHDTGEQHRTGTRQRSTTGKELGTGRGAAAHGLLGSRQACAAFASSGSNGAHSSRAQQPQATVSFKSTIAEHARQDRRGLPSSWMQPSAVTLPQLKIC